MRTIDTESSIASISVLVAVPKDTHLWQAIDSLTPFDLFGSKWQFVYKYSKYQGITLLILVHNKHISCAMKWWEMNFSKVVPPGVGCWYFCITLILFYDILSMFKLRVPYS